MLGPILMGRICFEDGWIKKKHLLFQLVSLWWWLLMVESLKQHLQQMQGVSHRVGRWPTRSITQHFFPRVFCTDGTHTPWDPMGEIKATWKHQRGSASSHFFMGKVLLLMVQKSQGQPPGMWHKTLVTHGINYQPQLDSRISDINIYDIYDVIIPKQKNDTYEKTQHFLGGDQVRRSGDMSQHERPLKNPLSFFQQKERICWGDCGGVPHSNETHPTSMKLEGTDINQSIKSTFCWWWPCTFHQKNNTRGLRSWCLPGRCVFLLFFGGDNIRVCDERDPPRSITNEGVRSIISSP